MRAKMSTNSRRGVMVPECWGFNGPQGSRGHVWLPEGPPDAEAALAEARAIVAEANDRECFDVASIEQIARAASEACGVAFRETHANIRGALAECLASFIVDGPR